MRNETNYISVEGDYDYQNNHGYESRLIGIFLYLEVPSRWGKDTKEIILTNTDPRELAKYVIRTIKKETKKNATKKALNDILYMVNRKSQQREEYEKRPKEDNTPLTLRFLEQINELKADDIAVKREVVEYNVWYA